MSAQREPKPAARSRAEEPAPRSAGGDGAHEPAAILPERCRHLARENELLRGEFARHPAGAAQLCLVEYMVALACREYGQAAVRAATAPDADAGPPASPDVLLVRYRLLKLRNDLLREQLQRYGVGALQIRDMERRLRGGSREPAGPPAAEAAAPARADGDG